MGTAVAWIRPAGHPALITPASRAYDLASGLEYLPDGFRGLAVTGLGVAPDQGHLVTSSGLVYALNRSPAEGASLSTSYLFSTGTVQAAAGQACFSPDGSIIYTAAGNPYEFQGTSLATRQVVQSLPGEAYPCAILCLWNGLVVGGVDIGYTVYGAEIFVYQASTGVQLVRLAAATTSGYRNLVARGMVASGDGTRLVSTAEVNSAGEVRFQTLPAPRP
jgi:hypothetical protein